MTGKARSILSLASFAAFSACAAPMTQIGTVTREQVAQEQHVQMRLSIETALEQQRRLDRVAMPLLRSAVPFCGEAVRNNLGLRLGSLSQFARVQHTAARELGFSEGVTLTAVTPGSPAEVAGLRIGDQLLQVGETALASARDPLSTATAALQTQAGAGGPVVVTFLRGDEELSATLKPEVTCAYDTLVERNGALNAFADGRRVVVTSGMMRFAGDEELAVVVGHEIAHNAMRHIEAKTKNAAFGAILGVIADVALAANGYNTGGEYTKLGAEAGSMVFSQDFEREADYVGLYILAGSGVPVTNSANLWRQLAAEDPGSILFARSHPTTAERFVRLGQWAGEIEQKIASGSPLEPEVRGRTVASSRTRGGDVATAVAAVPKRSGTTSSGAAPPTRSTSPSASPSAASAPAAPTPAPSVTALSAPAVPPAAAIPEASPTAPSRAEPTPEAPAAGSPPVGGPTLSTLADGRQVARATTGPPRSEADRLAATKAFAQGERHRARLEWSKAEALYREALAFDSSVAAYHGALGAVLVVLERGAEAEAAYLAALIIDPTNSEYRLGVLDARKLP